MASERDLVVLIAAAAGGGLGLLAAAEEVDRLRDDLATIAFDAVLVRPLGVMDAPADEQLHALPAILFDGLAETVEADNAVPFGVLDAAALVVLDRLALGIAVTRRGERELRDTGAVLDRAALRVLADIAGENDDVLHDDVSVASI
jgi:hypothetical protein